MNDATDSAMVGSADALNVSEVNVPPTVLVMNVGVAVSVTPDIEFPDNAAVCDVPSSVRVAAVIGPVEVKEGATRGTALSDDRVMAPDALRPIAPAAEIALTVDAVLMVIAPAANALKPPVDVMENADPALL